MALGRGAATNNFVVRIGVDISHLHRVCGVVTGTTTSRDDSTLAPDRDRVKLTGFVWARQASAVRLNAHALDRGGLSPPPVMLQYGQLLAALSAHAHLQTT